MTEQEFRDKWNSDKPLYEAWGDFVVSTILSRVRERGKDPEILVKIPPKYRLKTDESLIDKAFYRPNKSYDDPYLQIEDKVGARFVVLLLEDIDLICSIVEASDDWSFDKCRHFDDEKKANPMLFTYQSVHYVLRPKRVISHNGKTVVGDVPCELQIRTLLQHAHAELTHDAIYKAKRTVNPEVHRTVAKSMALIETTDGFFAEATKKLNHGPLEEHSITERFDGLYYSYTGIKPHVQKSSLVVWDEFEQFIDADLVEKVSQFVSANTHLSGIIKARYMQHSLFQQSVILFVYWMLAKRRQRLLSDWPFQRDILDLMATDLGISLQN